MPTDRALRHSCSRYIRARGAGPPEVKLRAAPETDRHTLQLSEPPPSHGRQSARHELSRPLTALILLVLCTVSV